MFSKLATDCETKRIGNVKQAKLSESVLGEASAECQNERKNDRAEDEEIFGQVFSIPLVFKEILKYLEKSDLLRTSLVDKNWNFFSREVLRDRNCLAIIRKRHSCHNFKKLNDLLANSQTVPFIGLSVSVSWTCHDHECIVYGNVSELLSNIFSKINIKYLSIHCQRQSRCSSLKLIREIFLRKAYLLEGLRLQSIPFRPSLLEFLGLNLTGHWLPNIRILKFPFVLYQNDLPKQFVKDLVEASPKLQELYGSINAECLEFIVPLKLTKIVKDFYLEPKINSLKNCLAFSLENPKLNKFSFSSSKSDNGGTFCSWSLSDQNDFARFVSQILESSKDSLKTVCLDHYDLILMMTKWNVPILKNVDHLSLRYDIFIDRSDELVTFRKINWAKNFPNLSDVTVTTGLLYHLTKDFYLSSAFQESNSQFVCESVRTFRSTVSERHHFRSGVAAHLQMFKQVFPNVTEFHLKESEQLKDNLRKLWTCWRDLEAIYVSVDVRPIPYRSTIDEIIDLWDNLDSVFLGVPKKEANYLLRSVKELGSLEIVPTKPSIFNLRKLKKIEIRFFHSSKDCSRNRAGTPQPPFLTRLAGQCAFSRLPGLSVEIHRHLCKAKDDCCLAFKQLKPFVKFVDR